MITKKSEMTNELTVEELIQAAFDYLEGYRTEDGLQAVKDAIISMMKPIDIENLPDALGFDENFIDF